MRMGHNRQFLALCLKYFHTRVVPVYCGLAFESAPALSHPWLTVPGVSPYLLFLLFLLFLHVGWFPDACTGCALALVLLACHSLAIFYS